MSSVRILDSVDSGTEHNGTTISTQLLVTVEVGGVDVIYKGITEPVAEGQGRALTVDSGQSIRVVATQNGTICDLANIGA